MSIKNDKIQIIDELGNSLASSENGEIIVKGDNVMLGYFRDDKSTEAAFKDEWIKSGDLGCVDEDGFLWFKG